MIADSGPDPFRAMRDVLIDVALVFVLTTLLGAAGVLLRTTAFDDGLTADTDPLSKRIAFELTADETSVEAQSLLDTARAAASQGAVVRLESHDDAGWLAGYFRGDGDRDFLGAAVRDAGLFSGRIRMSNASGYVIPDLATDPDRLFEAAGWLLPWMLSSTGLSFLLVGLWGARRRPTPPEEPRGTLAARVAAGIGVGVLAYVGIDLTGELSRIAGLPQNEQAWVLTYARGSTASFLVLLFVAGVMAPIGEEVFFRGHVFRVLKARASRRIAYTLSTVLFAAVHFNPSATMSYVLYAMIFAWAYERWKSVVVPMTAHALVNTVSVSLLRLEF